MNYQSLYQLNVKKLCIVRKKNEDGKKEFYTLGFFDPQIKEEDLISFLLKNSPEIINNWEKDILDFEFKSVNVPDNWAYLPQNEEELSDFKSAYCLH